MEFPLILKGNNRLFVIPIEDIVAVFRANDGDASK